MIDAHIEYQGEYSYEHLMEYVQAAIHNGIDEITILQPTHKFKECSLEKFVLLIPVRKNGMIV